MGHNQQAISQGMLERHCAPKHRPAFHKALEKLKSHGVDLVRIEPILFETWGPTVRHRDGARRKKSRIRFAKERIRARRDLLAASGRVVRLCEDTLKHSVLLKSPIYRLCRDLRVELTKRAAAVEGPTLLSGVASLSTDILHEDWDPVFSARALVQPRRGARKKPHKQKAREELARAGVPTTLARTLLRGMTDYFLTPTK